MTDDLQYGDYPLFDDPAHAIFAGILVGRRWGDLHFEPIVDGAGNYLPDLHVRIAGVDPRASLRVRVLPVGEDFVRPEPVTDPDGIRLSPFSAAHAVLWTMRGEPGAMQPGGYVEALVLAAARAHPLELCGVFARAYPALADAVDLYKNSEDGLAILRERAGLPAQKEEDAHAHDD